MVPQIPEIISKLSKVENKWVHLKVGGPIFSYEAFEFSWEHIIKNL
jgi:hypothetical protein